MNRYDMQDLIIEEEDSRGKKPKKVLTLFALIIVILLVGMMIMKNTMGEEKSKSDNSVKESKHIEKSDSELAPINRNIEINPMKNRHKTEMKSNINSEDELSEIMPISSEKKRHIQKQVESINSDILERNREPEINNIEEKKSSNQTAHKAKPVVHKAEPKHISKSHKQHTTSHTYHRTHKPKTATKPSQLFNKHTTTSTAKSNRVYYIQVGSFSKQPNQKYLSNLQKHGYKYKLFKSGGLTKVRVGPYTNYEFAKSKLPTIKKDLGISGFVVRVK